MFLTLIQLLLTTQTLSMLSLARKPTDVLSLVQQEQGRAL